MKNKRLMIILIIVMSMILSLPIIATAKQNDTQVKFTASECDSDGRFSIVMTISNAKFNAFQFVLRYDKDVVSPVDGNGNITKDFSAFAKKSTEMDWLSTIATNIDPQKGVIDFTGFVKPGSGCSTDNLEIIPGYVNIGTSGLRIFTFAFKRISENDVDIEIAALDEKKPYSLFLPEGAALIDAGARLPLNIEFVFPKSLGSGGSISFLRTDVEKAVTKEDRINSVIALHIGSNVAISKGVSEFIDPDNKAIHPYIDSRNRTMVPLRFIAEKLGALVEWDDIEKRITITSHDNTIIMVINSKLYLLNNDEYQMDTSPYIRKGWNRTMVPLRFVAEALGKHIEWDAENKLVIIAPLDDPWNAKGKEEREAIKHIMEEIITHKTIN